MIKHFCEDWLHEWCYDNGWTDLYIERDLYWAFPPGAVIPEPIPVEALRGIKADKGLSGQEKVWSISAAIATVIAAILSYALNSPLPMGFAFAFSAVAVALLEVEYN